MVTIRDRGPYERNRIVDLSPSSAEKIGITSDKGIARVKVAPISVPMPDGSIRGPDKGTVAQSDHGSASRLRRLAYTLAAMMWVR